MPLQVTLTFPKPDILQIYVQLAKHLKALFSYQRDEQPAQLQRAHVSLGNSDVYFPKEKLFLIDGNIQHMNVFRWLAFISAWNNEHGKNNLPMKANLTINRVDVNGQSFSHDKASYE